MGPHAVANGEEEQQEGSVWLAAIQEAARSAVPTLGYGVAYAVGNVLLALWVR